MEKSNLKHLSRREILEMLLRENKKSERLQKELDNATLILNNRRILCENVGSIAEASLLLNGVFDSAQNAADLYLENAKAEADKIITDAIKKANNPHSEILDIISKLNDIIKSSEDGSVDKCQIELLVKELTEKYEKEES